ncbi:MAG: efflux RND transporter permease subunit, partial [Deltaproteobacteria bacterium]|nr:efflux RND transporter permease subunit [Deltaproteobacteria bacterium]
DELKRVPGVGAIIVHGGLRRRINIYFDLAKLEGYGISLARVNQVLAAQNLNIPAGRIKSGTRDYFVRVPGRYKSAREVAETVIGYFNNAPIYLKDVAEVEDGYEPQDVNGWGDGLPALVLILQKQTGKNTVNVVRRVKEKLKELQEVLPSDVKINIIMDSSEDILTSVKNLRTTLFYGIFFVILVTLAFLRRLRTAFIISLTIPFSLIIAFILLYLFGYTINLVSLMSLAIASGMVVDNGIVVLENIMRHIERGGRIKTAAMLGASEMGLAISASTLTTVVVFVPLMFLTGLAGIIFKQLGITLVVTLTASLLVALMLIPTLASRLVKATPKALKQRTGTIGKLYGLSEEGFEFLERLYAGILGWALGHRRTVVALAVVIFLSSISLIPFLSTSFFPKVDSGDISIRFRLPEGSRIEETNKVMEAILKNIDEVVKPEEMRHSYAFDGETKEGIGVALGFDQGPNVGSIGFKLVDRDKRTRSADEIAAALRKRVRSIPGLNKIYVRAESGITSILMGTGKPVSLEIQGPDLEQLVRLANQVKQKMLEIPGLVDVEITQKDPRPELWVEVDRKKASALGLSVANIAVTLRNYFYGLEATKFREAGDNYDIFTRLTERDKNNLFNLPEAPIYTPDGRMIKLKNIAKIIQDEGPIEIERKNRQKIVKVEADTFGRS